MKRLAMVVLAVIVIAVISGCMPETKNTTTINNVTNIYYSDSNQSNIEIETMEIIDPNQYGALNLNFDFGDPNQGLKRGRKIQDLISFLTKSQASKVNYVSGYIYSQEPYRQYDFYIDADDSNCNVENIEIGQYTIYVYGYGDVIANQSFILFSGLKSLKVKKGQNECSVTMSLCNRQPIVVSLPDGQTLEGDSLTARGIRENGETFTTYFYPLTDNQNQVLGSIPIDLETLTISCCNRRYTFGPEIFDVIIFNETFLSLDDYEYEETASVEVDLQLEENKVLAGSKGNVVSTIKIVNDSSADFVFTVFEFEIEGDTSGIDDIWLTDGSSNTYLGMNNIEEFNSSVFTTQASIASSESITLFVEVDILPNASGEFSVHCESVKGRNDFDSESVNLEFKEVAPTFSIIPRGTLTVNAVNQPAIDIITAGSSSVLVANMKFSARNEDIEIESFVVTAVDSEKGCGEKNGYNDIDHIYVVKQVPSGNVLLRDVCLIKDSYQAIFDSESLIIPREQTVTINVTVDIADELNIPNAEVKFVISDIKAKGSSSGQPIEVKTIGGEDGKVEGRTIILRNSKMMFSQSSKYNRYGAAAYLLNGNACLVANQVNISAVGQNVLFYKLTYEVKTSEGVIIENPYLTDENNNIISRGEFEFSDGKYVVSFLLFGNSNVESQAGIKSLVVANGESETFRLCAEVSKVAMGSWISSRLISDDDCVPMGTAEEVAVDNNLVWSDNFKELSTSSETDNAVDASQWYNGHLIYPSYGFYTITY